MEVTVISGRLVRDIETKVAESGQHFAYGDIAVYQGKNKTGEELPPKYYSFVQFFKEAPTHLSNYTKGSVVTAQGKVDVDQYTDKTGEHRASLKLVASQLNLESKYKQTDELPTQTA